MEVDMMKTRQELLVYYLLNEMNITDRLDEVHN